MNIEEDRRRYFRIEDHIMLVSTRVNAETAKGQMHEMQLGLRRKADIEKPLLYHETQLLNAIANLKDKMPEMAVALEAMDKKLQYLMTHVNLPEKELENSIFQRTPMLVSLSACGISFSSDCQYHSGDYLYLEIVLLPNYTFLDIMGKVISRDKKIGQNTEQVSVDFEYVSDEDQEKLIQHILKKQAEQLQAKRVASLIKN